MCHLNGNLYLSRQFKINYGGGLLDDLPADALALEIQRSLDYYERQMGMSPPAVLFLCGENLTEDKITLDITRAINVPTKYLDLMQPFDLEDESIETMTHLCVGALGGVIRNSVAL